MVPFLAAALIDLRPYPPLQALTPDDFYEFHAANYTAPRMVLAVRAHSVL